MTVRDFPTRPEPDAPDFGPWLDKVRLRLCIDDLLPQTTVSSADETYIFSVSSNATNKVTISNFTSLISAGVPTGTILPYGGITSPSGYYLCDGSTKSRTTDATLWGIISANKGAATTPVASPGVVNNVGHGLGIGDAISFTTTGALPTGLVAGTTYYVISAGLTADAFEVATAQGGAAINFTGSTSGTHTLFHNPYGTPAADTANFLLPDIRGRVPAGQDDMGGTAANRITSGGSGIFGAAQGSVGGADTVTLTTAQLAAHTHTYNSADAATVTDALGIGGADTAVRSRTTGTASGSTGSGSAHNNAQPTIITNYIIKS